MIRGRVGKKDPKGAENLAGYGIWIYLNPILGDEFLSWGGGHRGLVIRMPRIARRGVWARL